MKLSRFDHAKHVCTWHNQEKQGGPCGPDRKWAQAWLSECERDGWVTADEANEIRVACGWPAQLQLFR